MEYFSILFEIINSRIQTRTFGILILWSVLLMGAALPTMAQGPGDRGEEAVNLVSDIYPSEDDCTHLGGPPCSSRPEDLTVYEGELYFAARDGRHGNELFRYNGSEVSLVKDLNTGTTRTTEGEVPASSNPQHLTVYDGALYFAANDGETDQELWRYDGTAVEQVADICKGECGRQEPGSSPAELTKYDGSLYFRARDEEHGPELWKYNGKGVTLVRDIYQRGAVDEDGPTHLTIFNDKLYLISPGPRQPFNKLWSYDGSSITSIDAGVKHMVNILAAFDGSLYYTADTEEETRLWHYDGSTAEQTAEVTPIPSLAGVVYEGALYFPGEKEEYKELWCYDGQTARRVGDPTGENLPSKVQHLTVYSGVLYFHARDRSTGYELWRYEEGSEMSRVADLNEGTCQAEYTGAGPDDTVPCSSEPSDFAVYDGVLYFAADGGERGRELWRYDQPENPFKDLEEGMKREVVLEKVGPPDEKKDMVANHEEWIYMRNGFRAQVFVNDKKVKAVMVELNGGQ
jgi:ELWxxDGT repeat protein